MDRIRHSVLSQSGAPSGICANDLTSTTANPMTVLPGPPQKKPVNAFNDISSPGCQQNLFAEMNIPVSRDNSNAHADHPKCSNFSGLTQSKISPRGIPSAFSFEESYGRDSPRLLTFSAETPPQQPFQSQGNARLAHYNGDDPVPSPMPKESPSEWRHSPRQSGQDSLISQPEQTYIHMTSPRDLLKQHQKSFNRSQSPKISHNQTLSLRESPTSLSINSPRSTEAMKGLCKSPLKESNRGQYCLDGSMDINHFNSFMTKQNPSLPSAGNEPQMPLLPPREIILLNDPNLIQNSLLDKELIKFSGTPVQNKGALPELVSMAPRDWNNESIATADDFDDQRSTTTSGSYTIDNEDEYLALEFKPKDIVV